MTNYVNMYMYIYGCANKLQAVKLLIASLTQSYIHDYGLASQTTNVVCVKFIHEQQVLQFNVPNPNDRFLRSLRFWFEISPEICWKKIVKELFFFLVHISFLCLIWGTNPDFMSNNPTHYLLDYGGFKCDIS